MAEPAESGSHRAMSLYQLDGSRCARIGITNSSPMIEVMVAAVCRRIDPAANANRPHRVTYSALPITARSTLRSEEHTSELQSRLHLVCRLLLEKKKKKQTSIHRCNV